MRARVLVVDDSIYERQVVRDHLVRGGHEVVGVAASGTEAVEQFERLRPDVVTLDLVLPYASGTEAAAQIYAMDPDARIIAVTGLLQPSVQAEAMRVGLEVFVGKPVDAEELLSEIQELLAR